MRENTRLDLIKAIKAQYGGDLRYGWEFQVLSLKIKEKTSKQISVSTLTRMIKGTSSPRLETLDIIALYLGYENWDLLEPEISR